MERVNTDSVLTSFSKGFVGGLGLGHLEVGLGLGRLEVNKDVIKVKVVIRFIPVVTGHTGVVGVLKD